MKNFSFLNALLVSIIIICNSLFTQEKSQYPGRNNTQREINHKIWEEYYECLRKDYKKMGPLLQRKIEARLLLPGKSIILSCQTCHRPFGDAVLMSWWFRKVGDANQFQPLDLYSEYTIGANMDLQITNGRAEFEGLYMCNKGNVTVAVYHIELPTIINLRKIDYREMKNYSTQKYKLNEKLVIQIDWEDWSACGACDKKGKKRRYGICMVTLSDEIKSIDEENKDLTKEVQLLSRYKHGVPCSFRTFEQQHIRLFNKTMATNFVAFEFCNISCPSTKMNNEFKVEGAKSLKKLKETLEGFRTESQEIPRQIIDAEVATRVILLCPGQIKDNIPLTWRINDLEMVPELVAVETTGRITIDWLDRLIFSSIQPRDSQVYSCFQREKLLGTIHIFVDQTTNEANFGLKLFTVFLLLLIITTIGSRAINRRKEMNGIATTKGNK